MNEFQNICWRDNLLEDQTTFITPQNYQNSYMKKSINKEINISVIRRELTQSNKTCKMKTRVPGYDYYNLNRQKSALNTIEHQRLINALEMLQSGKTKLNKFEQKDRELLQNLTQQISQENTAYLKLAESSWTSSVSLKMNNDLFLYAQKERLNKLLSIQKMPQFYAAVDLLPWSYSVSNIAVEMTQTANILDVGSVHYYKPPLLSSSFTLDFKMLPEANVKYYYSKLPIMEDSNIVEYFNTGNADVAISMSALKKLLHFTATNKLWTIPVIIKNVTVENQGSTKGSIKKVIFLGKPLVQQVTNKADLNERCHKLLVRTNLCRFLGLQFNYPNKQISTNVKEENPSSRPISNATYKLWTLQEQSDTTNIMWKNRHTKSFKILVRAKVDACMPTEHGLQGVTIVPKLEYQLKYGANCITKQEIVNQWTDLYFRPHSLLQRVRTHYMTSEVVKIDTVNIAKVGIEAGQHNLKVQQGFAVLYKLLLGLDSHSEGRYLLRHELKHGSFVGLYKETSEKTPNGFDLHHEYQTQIQLVDPYYKAWLPIDVNIVLPAFKERGHCPGLFKPCQPVANKLNKKKKKQNANKNKANKQNQKKGNANNT